MNKSVKLHWHSFEKLTEARSQFAETPCVYIQADARRRPIRVGKASKGLETRYRGGTGYALDAAMHESGNLIFVSAVSEGLCGPVESEIIWQGRQCLTYNNQGKLTEPFQRMKLIHTGTPPRMTEFN
jgi:hypothetical protein